MRLVSEQKLERKENKMSDKQMKQLRGQLRQIVKELFPELVASELYTNLQKKNAESMDLIHKLVKDTLERIDDRQKTVQSMVLRELSGANKPAEVTESIKSE